MSWDSHCVKTAFSLKRKRGCESPCDVTYKPGSVVSCHLSRPAVANRLNQPTHCAILQEKLGRAAQHAQPIWFFNTRGLHCRCSHLQRGGLLLHHFTLTTPKHGGILSVALAVTTPKRSPFPLGSVLLCVARTFLPCHTKAWSKATGQSDRWAKVEVLIFCSHLF